MMFSCPKCNADIELDLSSIPDEGTYTPCPECKSRFWTSKESFARRALKKEGKIYCEKCGKELDHSVVCAACGVLYSDYYLLQANRPPRRQVEKPDFSLSFSLRPAKQSYTYSYSYADTPQSGKKATKSLPKKVLLWGLVALLAAGLGSYLYTFKSQQLYAKNFVRALYTIKSGTDLGLSTCSKTTADWKAKTDAKQNYVPGISPDDESSLNKVKDATEKMMARLNEPPKTFAKSKEKLAALYGAYIRIHTLAVTPSGSLAGFTAATTKAETEFATAANELKTGMPEELSKELKEAKVKYKVLANF